MLGDEPPPSVEDAWPFDEDPLIEEDDVLPEDDLLPEDDAWSAGDQGVASSGRSHEDEPLDEEAWPLAAEVMAPIEPSPTGEHVPPAIDGVAQDLHARWARLLPRLSIAVSRTYRDQDEAAGRSIELAVWLSLSWSLDARALQRSIP